MNRREFLRGIGASMAALAVPAVKVDKRDELIKELEGEIAWWKEAVELEYNNTVYWYDAFAAEAEESNDWWERAQDSADRAADLAVQAAYWQEQYEQAKVALDHYRVSYQLWHNRACDLQAELTPDRPDPLDHFYQGDCHTEGEWRAHLLEQDRNA